jgi:acyl-CoA synthetase (AMP-forming)/AMP-acid ligase II
VAERLGDLRSLFTDKEPLRISLATVGIAVTGQVVRDPNQPNRATVLFHRRAALQEQLYSMGDPKGKLEFVKRSLSDHKVPSTVYSIDEMPLGKTGKVNRRALKELANSYNNH